MNSRPSNNTPMLYVKINNGAIVKGLLIQTSVKATGKFDLKKKASNAATIICPGIGKNATKTPTKKALEIEALFMWNKFGLENRGPMNLMA